MEFLQTVLENNGLTNEQKIVQLQDYIENIDPGLWDSEEEITAEPGEENRWTTNVWDFDNDVAMSPKYRYTFIPQIDGSRILDGEFIKYYQNKVVNYHARYIQGVILKSQTNYPSGNAKLECYYEDGLLYSEYHYPDDTIANRCGQVEFKVKTCNNVGETGYTKRFHYTETGEQHVLEYTEYFGGFKHGKYALNYPDRSTKTLGTYFKGKMHGQWRSFFLNGQPNFLQEWEHGELVHELLWNRQGHLVEKICSHEDHYYNNDGVLKQSRCKLSNGNWEVIEFTPSSTSVKFEERPNGTIVKPVELLKQFPKKFNFDNIKLKPYECIKKLEPFSLFDKKISQYECVKLLNGHPCSEYSAKRLNSQNKEDVWKKMWDDNFNKGLDYGFRQILIDQVNPTNFCNDQKINLAKSYFQGYHVSVMTMNNVVGIFVTVPEIPTLETA